MRRNVLSAWEMLTLLLASCLLPRGPSRYTVHVNCPPVCTFTIALHKGHQLFCQSDKVERRAWSPLIPHPQLEGGRIRNVPPPSRCTTCVLVFLFCLCCRTNFGAVLLRRRMGLGKHIVVQRTSDSTFFGLLSDLMQTFNSVHINPCAITAWMMSTCNGGSEFFDCFRVRAFCSHHFHRLHIRFAASRILVFWPG